MTHIAERPQQSIDRSRSADKSRRVGSGGLGAVEVLPPGVDPELFHKLAANTRGAAATHVKRVRELVSQRNGEEVPLNANTIRLAYESQRAKLKDSRVTDEMTTAQLTGEFMAKAVLFAPQVSEALRAPKYKESKKTFSEYQSILGEIAHTLPDRLTPGYKSTIVEVLKRESRILNERIGHSSEISGKDPQTGIDFIRQDLAGAEGEVAVAKGIKSDPNLEVIIPEDKDRNSDLAGIDLIVKRLEDGQTIFLDSKANGSYRKRIAQEQGVEYIHPGDVGSTYSLGMHERGHPHYLIDTDAFGEIPAAGFEYTPQGQAQLLRAVNELFHQ